MGEGSGGWAGGGNSSRDVTDSMSERSVMIDPVPSAASSASFGLAFTSPPFTLPTETTRIVAIIKWSIPGLYTSLSHPLSNTPSLKYTHSVTHHLSNTPTQQHTKSETYPPRNTPTASVTHPL